MLKVIWYTKVRQNISNIHLIGTKKKTYPIINRRELVFKIQLKRTFLNKRRLDSSSWREQTITHRQGMLWHRIVTIETESKNNCLILKIKNLGAAERDIKIILGERKSR